MSPRVLITGANGFLGRQCCRALWAAGWEVHAIGRGGADDPDVVSHALDLLTDDPTHVVAAARPTHLLHLAWATEPGKCWTDPSNRAWVDASMRLLKAFAAHGGDRAVLAGTCAEYDWSDGGVCREDETPIRPATLYGLCKDELRRKAEAFAATAKLSVAWARLFFLFGPGEHPGRLVPSVARALLRGESVDCSAGHHRRDFLHVSDAARGLAALLDAELTGPVNVGSGVAVPVRQVVATAARLLGRPDLVRFGARVLGPGEPPVLQADASRLKSLGWWPRFGLENGIEDAVSFWREPRLAAA